MKLIEITEKDLAAKEKAERVITKWLEGFNLRIGSKQYHRDVLKAFVYDNAEKVMKLGSETSAFKMDKVGHDGSFSFSWPLIERDLPHLQVQIINSQSASDFWIHNFNDFPNVNWIVTDRVRIRSLEGIDKLTNLRAIDFDDDKFTGGLLRLLKIPKLKKFTWYMTATTHNSKLHQALKIVEKHFRNDKDIAECMDELIEAGLKEYAKL
jgi:hypothetical protein